jgi:DNA-binding CsgD family transcriptional regulator
MGRLTKAKIDQIAKLRKEGYTQQETAQKTGVHVRTIRKYDVTRSQKELDNKTTIRNAQQAILVIMDWLWVFINPLFLEEGLQCPCCLAESMSYDAEAETFLCRQCGHKMILPWYVCENCLSLNTISFDRVIKKRVCRICGARQSR